MLYTRRRISISQLFVKQKCKLASLALGGSQPATVMENSELKTVGKTTKTHTIIFEKESWYIKFKKSVESHDHISSENTRHLKLDSVFKTARTTGAH